MSEFNFKKFAKTGAKVGNYSISFNGKSYTFGFNSGFYNKEKISQFKKVVLYFDKEKKAVAFQFTNDDTAEGSFTVVHSKNQSTGSVTVKSFVIDSDINKPEFFGKKEPILIKDENLGDIIVINLLEKNNVRK